MDSKRALLFHDEGVLDIAVSTAEAINFPSRWSASFTTFLFIAEQLIKHNRADLAALLGSRLFPRDGPSHPIFSDPPDRAAWIDFMTKDQRYYLHPPSKGFAGVCEFGQDQFQLVARHIFLAHELGHYLARSPYSERALLRLKASYDVLQDDEASADLIGALLTVASLSRSVQRPGAMTWLVAKTSLLLRIHHAFVGLRQIIQDISEDPGATDHQFNAASVPGGRADLIERELSNPDMLQNLFQLAGSRARVIDETLVHYQEYACLVVNSIVKSAAVIVETLLRAWRIVTPPNALPTWRISPHELDPQDVLSLVRDSLGNDIFRVLSAYSNHAQSWGRPLPAGLSLDLMGRRSAGIKKLPFTNAIFLDVSAWLLEAEP